MTLETLNPRENFNNLVKKGYKIIKLSKDLTPIDTGFNKPDFVYETEYREKQNYGIVGGSTHKSKDGTTGKMVFVDFDVKEKYFDEDGQKHTRIIPEAVAKLKDVLSIVFNRNYYFATTKSKGLHMGVLSNENIPQGVSLYTHQDCEILRIDTRTDSGYVVAIAPNYEIINIPETFDRVIPDFEQFMLSLSFIPSNKISNTGELSGALSSEYKRKSRDALDSLDAKTFPELGTEKIATHDFISFSVMSCRSRNIPLDETTEKIMYLLGQINTSKNNITTEIDIQKLYNKEYTDFKPTAKLVDRIEDKENLILISNEDKLEFVNSLIAKYDIVTPFNTNEIFYRDEVVHRLGIDGILKDALKGFMIKRNDFNDFKFNIEKESQIPDPFDNDLIGLDNIIFDQTLNPVETKSYVKSSLARKFKPELIDNEDVISNVVKGILGDQYNKFLATCVILFRGRNDIQKLIYFDGKPDSGKSTLLKIFAAFRAVKTEVSLARLQKDPRLLTQIEFLNVTDEAENCIVEPEIFKNIIDGMPMQESGKYVKELKEYDPKKHIQIAGGNGMPDVRGNNGIAKRIVRIHCKEHFEKNDTLLESITTNDNLDRFLLTVIDYARLNEKNPLLDMSTDDKVKIFDKISDPIGYFVENFMVNDGGECFAEDVRKRYKKFCDENDVTKEYTPDKFGKTLSQTYGIKSSTKTVDGKSVRHYKGWVLVSTSFD